MKKLLLMFAVLLLAGAGFAATTTEDVLAQKNNVQLALNQEGQDDYFYHQNLLFPVEDLNKAYVDLKHDHAKDAAAVLVDLSGQFASSKYGNVTLLQVIDTLENYDWNAYGNVDVRAQELKKDLSKLPNIQDNDIKDIIWWADQVREGGLWKAPVWDDHWQNLMGALERLEDRYADLKAKNPLKAAVALRAINTNDYKCYTGQGSLLWLMEEVDSHLHMTTLQTPNLYNDLRTLK